MAQTLCNLYARESSAKIVQQYVRGSVVPTIIEFGEVSTADEFNTDVRL